MKTIKNTGDTLTDEEKAIKLSFVIKRFLFHNAQNRAIPMKMVLQAIKSDHTYRNVFKVKKKLHLLKFLREHEDIFIIKKEGVTEKRRGYNVISLTPKGIQKGLNELGDTKSENKLKRKIGDIYQKPEIKENIEEDRKKVKRE